MGFHLPIMPVYMCIVYSLTSFSPPGRMSHGLWPVSPLNHAYGQTQTPLCYFPLPFHHRHHQHQIHLLRHHHKISEVEGVHLSPGIISCKLNKNKNIVTSPSSPSSSLFPKSWPGSPLLSEESEVTIWHQNQNQDPSHHHPIHPYRHHHWHRESRPMAVAPSWHYDMLLSLLSSSITI